MTNEFKSRMCSVSSKKAKSMNIGGEVFLTPEDRVTLIEWADIIQEILPLNVITLNFYRPDGNPQSRQIDIHGVDLEV